MEQFSPTRVITAEEPTPPSFNPFIAMTSEDIATFVSAIVTAIPVAGHHLTTAKAPGRELQQLLAGVLSASDLRELDEAGWLFQVMGNKCVFIKHGAEATSCQAIFLQTSTDEITAWTEYCQAGSRLAASHKIRHFNGIDALDVWARLGAAESMAR